MQFWKQPPGSLADRVWERLTQARTSAPFQAPRFTWTQSSGDPLSQCDRHPGSVTLVRVRRVALRVVIVLLVLGLGSPSLAIERRRADTLVTGASNKTSNLYGVPWNADGLSNVPIGVREKKVGIRFRADRDGTLDRIKLFFIFATWKDQLAVGSDSCQVNHNDCYGAGDGGEILVTLRADNGTDGHFPSRKVLSSRLIRRPMNRIRRPPFYAAGNGFQGRATHNFRVLNLPNATLQAGRIYHLVFSNQSAHPRRNYVSLDHLYLAANTPGMQPGTRDVDLASEVLYRGTSKWRVRHWETPIYQVHYANGFIQGQGYIGTSRPQPTPIYGRYRARERITAVARRDRTISKVFVRLNRRGKPGPLTLRLEKGDGALIGKGAVPTSTINRRYGWVPLVFNKPYTLQSGSTYNIELSAKGDRANHYRVFALWQGRRHGFHANNLFRDGYAQVNRGSGWLQRIRGAGAAHSFDFQMYAIAI